MKQDGKFILLSRQELKTYLDGLKNVKNFTSIQQHHTACPSYKNVKNNHIVLMKGMESYHVGILKMSEIAQHFSTFPDGMICAGRPLTKDGGGFVGALNQNSITIENVGNFDEDIMSEEQKQSIILLNALLCKRFGITPSTESLPYHCWVSSKTCPGTKYFDGNTKEAAEKYFIPVVKAAMKETDDFEAALWLVAERANTDYRFWLKKRDIDPSFKALIIKIAKAFQK